MTQPGRAGVRPSVSTPPDAVGVIPYQLDASASELKNSPKRKSNVARILVSLGGNALGVDFDELVETVGVIAEPIVGLLRAVTRSSSAMATARRSA